MSSDEEYAVCYLLDGKSTEEGGSKKTCWVHPYCNRSGEGGSFVVARKLDWGSTIVHRTVQEHTGKCSVLPFLE
jgi:hypothetical protein